MAEEVGGGGVVGIAWEIGVLKGLRDAGVDMTTDEPLDLTMKRMNEVMDQMEELLAR